MGEHLAPDLTADLLRSLDEARDNLLRALDGLRETIGGRAGSDPVGLGDHSWWAAYVAGVQAAADAHRE